jgi:hypothetical protein
LQIGKVARARRSSGGDQILESSGDKDLVRLRAYPCPDRDAKAGDVIVFERHLPSVPRLTNPKRCLETRKTSRSASVAGIHPHGTVQAR